MKIKLDGKDNIFDNLYKDLLDNKATGTLSEKEMKKIIDKVNKKVTHDYYNKPVLKIKRTQESDYMAKAKDTT